MLLNEYTAGKSITLKNQTPERKLYFKILSEQSAPNENTPLNLSDLDTPFDHKPTPELEAAAYLSGCFHNNEDYNVKEDLRNRRNNSLPVFPSSVSIDEWEEITAVKVENLPNFQLSSPIHSVPLNAVDRVSSSSSQLSAPFLHTEPMTKKGFEDRPLAEETNESNLLSTESAVNGYYSDPSLSEIEKSKRLISATDRLIWKAFKSKEMKGESHVNDVVPRPEPHALYVEGRTEDRSRRRHTTNGINTFVEQSSDTKQTYPESDLVTETINWQRLHDPLETTPTVYSKTGKPVDSNATELSVSIKRNRNRTPRKAVSLRDQPLLSIAEEDAYMDVVFEEAPALSDDQQIAISSNFNHFEKFQEYLKRAEKNSLEGKSLNIADSHGSFAKAANIEKYCGEPLIYESKGMSNALLNAFAATATTTSSSYSSVSLPNTDWLEAPAAASYYHRANNIAALNKLNPSAIQDLSYSKSEALQNTLPPCNGVPDSLENASQFYSTNEHFPPSAQSDQLGFQHFSFATHPEHMDEAQGTTFDNSYRCNSSKALSVTHSLDTPLGCVYSNDCTDHKVNRFNNANKLSLKANLDKLCDTCKANDRNTLNKDMSHRNRATYKDNRGHACCESHYDSRGIKREALNLSGMEQEACNQPETYSNKTVPFSSAPNLFEGHHSKPVSCIGSRPKSSDWIKLNNILRQNGFDGVYFEGTDCKNGDEVTAIDLGEWTNTFFDVLKEFEKRLELSFPKNGDFKEAVFSYVSLENLITRNNELESEVQKLKRIERTNERLRNELHEAEVQKNQSKTKLLQIKKELNDSSFKNHHLEVNIKKQEQAFDKLKLQLEKVNESAENHKQKAYQIIQKFKGKVTNLNFSELQVSEIIHLYESKLSYLDKENKELRRLFRSEGSRASKLEDALQNERITSKCFLNSFCNHKSSSLEVRHGEMRDMEYEGERSKENCMELVNQLEAEKAKRAEMEQHYQELVALKDQKLHVLLADNDALRKGLEEHKKAEVHTPLLTNADSIFISEVDSTNFSKPKNLEKQHNEILRVEKTGQLSSALNASAILQDIRLVLNVSDDQSILEIIKKLKADLNGLPVYKKFIQDLYKKLDQDDTNGYTLPEILSAVDVWKEKLKNEMTRHSLLKQQLFDMLSFKFNHLSYFSDSLPTFEKNVEAHEYSFDSLIIECLNELLDKYKQFMSTTSIQTANDVHHKIVEQFMKTFSVEKLPECFSKISLIEKELSVYSGLFRTVRAALRIPSDAKLHEAVLRILEKVQNVDSTGDVKSEKLQSMSNVQGSVKDISGNEKERNLQLEVLQVVLKKLAVENFKEIPPRLNQLINCLDKSHSECKVVDTLMKLLNTSKIEEILPRLHRILRNVAQPLIKNDANGAT